VIHFATDLRRELAYRFLFHADGAENPLVMVGVEEIVMRKFLIAALMTGVASFFRLRGGSAPPAKAPPAPVLRPLPPYSPGPAFYVRRERRLRASAIFRGSGNTTFGNPNGGLVGGTARL